jgi:hypothetical protein
MRANVYCRVDSNSADSIGVKTVDLLGEGAKSEKRKAEG